MTSPLKLALLAAAATLSLAAPAQAQMDHSKMPGMNMPAPQKVTPKKPVAQKAASKKAVAKTAVTSSAKAATKKPTAKSSATSTTRKVAPDPRAGQQLPKPAPSESTCLPEHAAMGHCTPGAAPARAQQPVPQQPQAQSTCLPEHAAMGHCTPAPAAAQQPAPQSQPTCLPEHAAMGHCTPAPKSQGNQVAEGTDLPAGNAPAPEVPVANAADAFYPREAMEMGRHHLQEFHGGQKLFQVMNNISEYRAGKGPDGYGWETEAWYGGDINRLWLKSEGEGAFGEGVESAEVQALYSKAIDPYWNVQGGLRYDFKPDPSRVYATVQLEGLAPSFFDVEGALFLSNKGEVMARLGGWYDQRITQRLILQPRVELDLAAQNSREIGVGAGLSEAEVGVRLRYDIRREFAPYIGVQYQRAFGRTARYLRDEGERAGGWQFLAGVRTWF